MSRRLVVTGGSRPRELVLVGTMVVGRDPACDISEGSDPLLSRRHAEFTSGASEVTVRDLSGRNGILVNGIKTPRSSLRTGDVVQIGHLQVKFLDEVGPFLDIPGVDTDAPTRRAHAEPVMWPVGRAAADTELSTGKPYRSPGAGVDTDVPTKKFPS